MNIGEKDNKIGLYLFEPIKDIFGLISDLDCDKQLTEVERKETRNKIYVLWADMRRELLKEFDREVPTFSHTHWDQPDKAKIYDAHDIEKRPT